MVLRDRELGALTEDFEQVLGQPVGRRVRRSGHLQFAPFDREAVALESVEQARGVRFAKGFELHEEIGPDAN